MGILAGRMSGLRSPFSHRLVDDSRHQAQHAACTLELDQRGPIGVEAVEDFGMDGIGSLDAVFIIGIVTLGREFGLLGAVQIGKGARHHVAVFELRRIGERLEQTPTHDLEAFFGSGGTPG